MDQRAGRTEVGIPYGFGSDWPASIMPELNGFYEMQGFVTRLNPNEPEKGTLNADQALTLEQAVYGFTMGGAHNMGFDWPDKIGSIEEGKLADFIVIDRNIFEIPIETLKDTQVELTVVGAGWCLIGSSPPRMSVSNAGIGRSLRQL